MKLTLAEPKYLKDSVSIISDLVNDATFKVTKDGLELVAMDPANVAMVIFKLLSSCFIEYDVKKEMNITINMNNLKQILRRAKPNDMLSLEMDEDNRLKIVLKSNTTRAFSIPLIEVEEKEQKVPELKFEAVIKTTAEILNDSIEDADIVADAVSFIAEPNKFIIEAEGDLSKSKTEVKSGEDTKITVKGDKVRSKYSIEYLKKMIGGSKLSNDVTIQFSKDYPLKIDFKAIDKLLLSFILAPRVEND